jgi:hypothetical protein
MKTGLESLDTGAPEITYSGNEGPKSPQQMQQMQQMQMAQLEEEYDAYVDDMIEQGIEPMSMRQFLEQIAAEAQMSSNEEGIGTMMQDPRQMAAGGGIMRTGVKHPDGRTGFFSAGLAAGDDISPGTSTSGGSQGGGYGKGGPPGGGDPGMTYTAPPKEYDRSKDTGPNRFELAAANAKEKARLADIEEQKKLAKIKKEQEEKEKREKDAREFFKKQDKKKQKSFFSKILSANKTPNRKAYLNNLKKTDPVAYAEMIDELEKLSGQTVPPSMGFKTPNLVFGPPGDKDIEFGDLSTVDTLGGKFGFGEGYDDYMDTRLNTGSGGGGGGGQQIQQPATPPGTPPPATPPGIPTDPVTGQYSNEYFIPNASNFYSNLPSTMFNPTTNMLTLAADGGRIGYAGGGIANLRQGYFLGKLVKKITKPFKKAFKGFKKIAKSPMGKMALLALGGYYLGGGAGLGGKSMFGNTGFQLGKLPGASFFNQTPGKSKIAENFVLPKFPPKKPILDSGNFLTKAMGFAEKHPFAAITGISTLSGLYTDYVNNKRQDETMADYQRRLEEERGNFAPIPVDPVQFAANGGRMGFADGGDDDDEDFRQKALGALYSMRRPQFSMGGGAGMPPVTMMSEGQDVQSFGDDESTGMPQATPTMQNQMPMRPPMMDPRMQQQMMMAQRGNPMMNRGMMSMQQPRIMAQEGGMMDMGGMEKDYRNEGGFVPIGGQERADDVPARLSKNEFVFTADAVRNAGGGDIDRGAEIMENMMENLEAGGKISEASQGLKGAREMFATQQRLGEVL